MDDLKQLLWEEEPEKLSKQAQHTPGASLGQKGLELRWSPETQRATRSPLKLSISVFSGCSGMRSWEANSRQQQRRRKDVKGNRTATRSSRT